MNQESAEYFMREALIEGRKARVICGDNPPVGCVLVCDGEIIARGHTNEPGKPHAEAMALAKLQEKLRDITAFVTLEPCSFHGRTPSCADALVEYGITKLYVGLIDPDSRNNGAGIRIAENAGIKVNIGMLSDEIFQDIGSFLITCS